MSFKNLLSHERILKAIAELGYETPTPIQQQAIPCVMEGKDLLASAQTGTGKTAAFVLPAIHRLSVPSTLPGKGPRVLILVPTRELAMQVATETQKYSKYLARTKTVCIFGGAPYPVQNRQLSSPYEILVATPGRLIDHLQAKRVNLSRVEMLILDEADRMLDMGFIEPVQYIAAETPASRQTLLFSATLKGNVMNLSKELLRSPVKISVVPIQTKHENIEQRLMHVDNIDHKYRLLETLLNDTTMNQAVVFTSTKSQADEVADKLVECGLDAAALHGDMRQRERTRTLAALRSGKIRVLVATDVAARGIDVQTITHVINFDLPMNAEDYVHRIGRTGRAGASGVAFSFVSPRDRPLVGRIERFTGQKIVMHSIAGLEPKSAPKDSGPSSNFYPKKKRFSSGPHTGPRTSSRARTGTGARSEYSQGENRSKKPFSRFACRRKPAKRIVSQ